MKIISRQLEFRQDVQDEAAAAQLRHILITGHDFSVMGDCLEFDLQGERVRLYPVNRNVILTPGTQIFFSMVDEASFSIRGSVIYIYLKRGEKEYERALVHI